MRADAVGRFRRTISPRRRLTLELSANIQDEEWVERERTLVGPTTSRFTEGTAKQQQRDAEQTFRSTYVAHAQAFAKETPDFKDAYTHLVQARNSELEAMGIADPQERARMPPQTAKRRVRSYLRAVAVSHPRRGLLHGH